MPGLLWTSYRRYLVKNWWLPLLSVCAIATGVAVILAIDIASVSARRSFALSTETLTGRATHSLVAAGQTVPDGLYRLLRVDWGYRRSAPVVEGDLQFPDFPGEPTLSLLGVDLLTDQAVREWTDSRSARTSAGERLPKTMLLGSADQVVASRTTAERWGWKVGESRQASSAGRPVSVRLAATLEPESAAVAAALDNLLLADIATAQNLLRQRGLDRVDLVLAPGEEERLAGRIADLEPFGALVLQAAGSSQQTAAELSEAFHTSLQALSYLCLLVAMFLIFNVVSFSVAHRRQSLGRLRVLGVTSTELGRLLLTEMLLLGGSGSMLGLAGGVALGRGLVPLVARSVNDLYYLQSITSFSLQPSMLGKALFWGLAATAVAAWLPARLAARSQPLDLFHRVQRAGHGARWAQRCAAGGLGCLLLSLGLLSHPSLSAGLFALLAIVIGYGLLVPGALLLSVALGRRLSSRLAYRMALQGLAAHFTRSATAAVTLTVAVAATVSIAMMVSSFRGTLTGWLETTLTADIYLTLKSRPTMASREQLSPEAVKRATSLPGVRDWSGQRAVVVPSETSETLVVGLHRGEEYLQALRFLEKDDQALERFKRGEGVLLTEPYARRSGKTVGDSLRLYTPAGPKSFPVLGVYYSYAPDRNSATLAASGFEPLFGAERYTGLAFYLRSDEQSAETVAALKGIFGESVEVRATGELRRLALEIFERTFTVTAVLRQLALGVALVGVLLSLTALAIEREKEVGVLRALGFLGQELWGLSVTQSAWLGWVTGLLACPLGALLAYVMIAVLNRRAFGWTIDFLPDLAGMASSLGLSVFVSVLAGLYPAWRWSRRDGGAERE